jgi:hypothetical protein
LFHSAAKSIRSYQKDVPYLLVADPYKVFYKEFGVETSLSFMSLKALSAGMRGMVHGHFGLVTECLCRRRCRLTRFRFKFLRWRQQGWQAALHSNSAPIFCNLVSDRAGSIPT